jgi:uncharacterized OsmC-like protein/pimeloyl-ACP methyl ester carboxylesterase
MLNTEAVVFEGASAERLSGELHLPAGEILAYALFAHCFTCSKNSRAARGISASLAQNGIATLRFDFTGLGDSEGDASELSFARDVADLVAAADFLKSRDRAPSLLVGHSLGGAAVLAAAEQIEEAVAVATIGAPADPEHLATMLGESFPMITERGEANVELGGRPVRIRQRFLDELEAWCNEERIASLGKALLIFHSPQDRIVSIDNARQIYLAAKHPKSFVSLDGADHLLGRRRDSEYVGTVLAAWATRYLPQEEADELDEELPEGDVLVEGNSSGFLQAVHARRHHISSDEPLANGGTDLGLTPYELLLAGLGACTSMTLKHYADRKGWPLQRVRVKLRHGRIHAEDCQDCEKETGKIDVIEKELQIEGPLDAEQRDRLFEIAGRCPVHRTLLNEIKIRSTLLLADPNTHDASSK